ncbi:hypothetical protein [Streptomyces sp. NPDC020983]|uniref:hypothetical protein n=1 Tax=Streptomyces sp. NPDC020983 TaxID=3365106 RepID=UPI0037B65857
MTWAKLDDRFPSHRKVALLSDRAFRLHVSAICWSAENLTDGHIGDRELPLITRIRGVKTTAQELETAGLWDRGDDGWVIHDYLDYNPSREQVLLERKKNAERQERFRRRKNGKPTPPGNGSSNGVTRLGEKHDGDTNAARRRHDGDTTAPRNRHEEPEDPQVSRSRDGVTNGAPTRPDPTPTTSMAEVGGESAGSKGSGGQRPDGLHLIPDDFHLNDTMRRWVLATYPSLDPDFETEQFIRYWRSEGRRKRNWHDAWQKWIADSYQRARERQQRSNVVPFQPGQRPSAIRGPLPTADEINNLTIEDVL